MNSKFYVSLETARLIKEQGYNNYSIVYDCSVKGSILLNQQPIYGEWVEDKDVYPCPTKAEAIDWLESKEVLITSHPVTILREDGTTKTHWSCHIVHKDGTWYTTNDLPTRLEAEEAAIIKALELL